MYAVWMLLSITMFFEQTRFYIANKQVKFSSKNNKLLLKVNLSQENYVESGQRYGTSDLKQTIDFAVSTSLGKPLSDPESMDRKTYIAIETKRVIFQWDEKWEERGLDLKQWTWE